MLQVDMRLFYRGFATLVFLIGIAMGSFIFGAQEVSAAAISWDGDAADGEWESATNWSGDAVPTDADDVTIDVSETIAINGTTTINSLTLGNTNSPVLNFDYDAITNGALIIDDGNLTVGSNATIQHTAASNATVVGTVYIDVQTGNADIDGSIDVEALGHPVNYGTGAGGSGGGGGHGGYGGGPNAGTVYGSVTAPVTLGSGSGSGQSNWSRGGGAIRLTVAGTLDLDAAGVISADGGDNTSWYGPAASAGSVYLDVGTLAGSGAIRADGGGTDQYYYGEGGGGRIAIYYDTDSSTITPTAYGGKKTSDSRVNFGGAGTVYMKDNAQTYGDLIIDNNSYHNNSDYELGKTPLATATYRNITLSNNGHLVLESGATITYTTLTWTDGEITDDGGTLAGVTSGNVTVATDAYLYANTARTGGSALTSLTINGTVLHSQNTSTQTYSINLATTGNTTIGASGSINVDHLGFTANNGPCPGVSSGDDGGAGNGGQGGSGAGGAGGDVCGTLADSTDVGSAIVNPDLAGSGGGDVGGTGGGVVKLVVGGTFSHAGDITADASNAGTSGGGAAGGSIWIDADTISGSGSMGANGSVGYNNNFGDGGGGRIAIYYDTDSSSAYTLTAYGGQKAADTKRFGGAGTIYVKDNAASYGDLTIDNNSYTDVDDRFHGRTVLAQSGVSESYIFDTVTISNSGYLDVTTDASIAVTTVDWAGGIIADNGGSFGTITSGDVVIPVGGRLLANNASTVDSLTINGTMAHSANGSTEDYKIAYSVNNDVTIASGGEINVQGLGYSAANGPGAGTSDGTYGSGAGHAGTGGDTTTAVAGGSIYDTIESPDTIGSSGGYKSTWYSPSGGGAVKIMIGGDFVINGDVNADAGTTGSWFSWGGSAGGSIWIIVDGTCSGTGDVTAKGGPAETANAGAGAGGYILMLCGSTTWSGTDSVIAGTVGQTAEDGISVINYPPTVTEPTTTPASDGTGEVIVETTIDDSNDDDVKLKVEYSDDGGSTWYDATLSEDPSDLSTSTGTPTVENDDTYQIGTTTGIDTSSGANTVSFVWNVAADEPTGDISNAQIRITPADTYIDGSPDESPSFAIDNVAPVGLADMEGTVSGADVDVTWTAATDSNFNHYEIWYGSVSSDVSSRTGTATEWDDSDDAALATATTTSTTVTSPGGGAVYFAIWAIDDFGNEATTTGVLVSFPSGGSTYWEPEVPGLDAITISQNNGSTTDNLTSGTWTKVEWESSGIVPFVDLFYSENQGFSWHHISGPIANRDYFGFVMPDDLVKKVMFKVEATDLVEIIDTEITGAVTILSDLNDIPDEEESEEESVDIPSVGPGDYVRSQSSSTVYLVTDSFELRPFYSVQIYFTWEDSFDKIKIVADEELSPFIIAEPMLPKPGVVLVKIPSDPKVYSVVEDVDGGYLLKWITSEELATSIYGEYWADFIIDLSTRIFARYKNGPAVESDDSDLKPLKMKKRVDLQGAAIGSSYHINAYRDSILKRAELNR